ncbi:MAG: class I SAM-dependent methyltransferase [Sphingomonadales bacterium]|nr:MAG: class I SAM-dependent methyltransferase [Sphingomonadales bacterium]
MRDVLNGYAAYATADLVARYDALEPERIYAQVIDLFPPSGARVADVGAGTGRDAAWFAARGYRVLAVEPVAEFREAGKALHPSDAIEWLDDRLPDLAALRASAPFDMVMLCAVWHHLDQSDRARALTALAEATVTGGLLVLSLRHDPGADSRQTFPTSAEETIDTARALGLRLVRQREADSVSEESRAAGVRWTWLAFEKA